MPKCINLKYLLLNSVYNALCKRELINDIINKYVNLFKILVKSLRNYIKVFLMCGSFIIYLK